MEKVRLAGQATLMLWNPKVSPSDTSDDSTSVLTRLRASVEPIYTALVLVPRRFAALALTVLGYQWLMAVIFVGATRYRVPWDFVVALLAAAALVELAARLSRRARARSEHAA